MKEGRHKLTSTDKEILESCKMQMKLHIEKLMEQGVRKANIEIELSYHIKNVLYSD
ncbi:hypothetical protein [Robertmurraya siralis]|uniref:hypothetical protein n=1 Tax=Robertmurraya siralis TaxID=77777 RepID=UPI001476DBAE|nr:hypothetical protein [Robertmurraya siralis]